MVSDDNSLGSNERRTLKCVLCVQVAINLSVAISSRIDMPSASRPHGCKKGALFLSQFRDLCKENNVWLQGCVGLIAAKGDI